MRTYELMLILNPQLEEEAIEATLQKVESIVTTGNGEILNVNKWGKRRLAYEINDNTDGFYVVIDLKAENEVTFELERILKITGEVLRHLLIRKGE